MAKKGEPEIPEYITKHKKLYGSATKLGDTVAHAHSVIYTAAVDKHLRGEDGQVDFNKLDDAAVQKQFIKTMSDMYVSKAKDHFKVEKDLNDLEKDLLMQAYTGVTKGEIQKVVLRYGKRLNHQQFDRIKGQIQQNVTQRLYAAAGSHIERGHIPSIIKHIPGLEDKVNTAVLDEEDARHLLEIFHEEGTISDSALQQIFNEAPHKIRKKKAA